MYLFVTPSLKIACHQHKKIKYFAFQQYSILLSLVAFDLRTPLGSTVKTLLKALHKERKKLLEMHICGLYMCSFILKEKHISLNFYHNSVVIIFSSQCIYLAVGSLVPRQSLL